MDNLQFDSAQRFFRIEIRACLNTGEARDGFRAARSVLQLDVVPKPDPVSYPGMGGLRRLVRPGRALARIGSVREIEKPHTVGAAMVGLRLRSRLQKFHAY